MAADAQEIARRVHGAPSREEQREEYVGAVTRAIAFAFDAAVINVIAIVVGAIGALIFSLFRDLPSATSKFLLAAAGALFILWSAGYFVAFWTTTGQTPGNRMMRIRVRRAPLDKLKPRHALMRLIGILLSLPLLWGFVGVLISDRRRGFHDWLSGTVVVSAPDQGGWLAAQAARAAGSNRSPGSRAPRVS